MFNFWFFKKKDNIPENPGWVRDPVDHQDYRHEEILGSLAVVPWQEIDPKPEPMFPIKNQDRSSSCVGQTVSKTLGVVGYYENGIYRDLSARFPYAQRTNQGLGMYMREAMEFGIKIGCPLEQILPSQNLSEEEMNKKSDIVVDVKQVALVYKAKSYLYCNLTFDNIAALLQQKIPVAIGVAGTNEGWVNTNGWVRPPKPGEEVWYHAMMIAPENKKGQNFGLINGKKTLIVDNSWGVASSSGYRGQVFFTEEYLPSIRWNFYFLGLPDDWRDKEPENIEKPKASFDHDLFYGLKQDIHVISLQKCLKWYGTFPKNLPETGNYYGITTEAVESFQLNEGIAKADEAGYGRCGPKTREVLNKIFK